MPCVWIDPCNTIVSASRKVAFDERQANYGKGPRWMSNDSRKYSRNLRASPYAGKQARWGDRRQWWFVVLFRGHVHFEFMPDSWQQTGDGLKVFIERLPGILSKRLGDDAWPRVVFSDRGPGLYQTSSGHIVGIYQKALQDGGFRPFAGADASWQPADIPNVLLHETVVGWVRAYVKRNPLERTENLERNVTNLKITMEACRRHIQSEYDVEGLCTSFRGRLAKLVAAKGGRLDALSAVAVVRAKTRARGHG